MYVTGRQASLNSHYFPMDKHLGILSTDVFWFQGEIVNLGREVTAWEVQVVVHVNLSWALYMQRLYCVKWNVHAKTCVLKYNSLKPQG